jgi:uncharacterized small protein (DUF1192 family)
MDHDEILAKNAGDPLAALLAQDLDPLSVKELKARVASLQVEIDRTTAKLQHAVEHRAAAHDIFKS